MNLNVNKDGKHEAKMTLAKFLVVYPSLDIYGGAEKVCHNVLKTLVQHGQNVQLLTFDFDPQRYTQVMGEDLPEGVVVHALGKRMDTAPPFTIYKKHHSIVHLLKKFRDSLEYDFLFMTQSSSPFEPVFLSKAKKNIAYLHFPEIHVDYSYSSFKRKVYLWLFKRWVEAGIRKLDVVFCNSHYTQEMIERYWSPFGVKSSTVVYPPVNLTDFWCSTPPGQRRKRVVYIGRFVPMKRHGMMKKLAADFPEYEFVSIGGFMETEKEWFNRFSKDLPSNYVLKPNLPGPELRKTLQESRIYAHLMEGEHFGIAPIEAAASGCITLVHNSGGPKEFIPEGFRWKIYEDLKQKIKIHMDEDAEHLGWEKKREEIWSKISILSPENFKNEIWSQIEKLL